jgi:sugar O-acyltransferase (sialic acid O-acetyltransferase NeuD family)
MTRWPTRLSAGREPGEALMDVVIFGLGPFASLVDYVLRHDSDCRVVGFTADRSFCAHPTWDGRPVVPFDALEAAFPPGQVRLLLAIGGSDGNRLRSQRFAEASERGWRFATYVCSRALTWPDLSVGEGSLLFEGCMVNPFASIGRNCVLRSGSVVSHHAVLGDHCFLGAQAVVAGGSRVGERGFLGLHSTVRDRVTVAERCIVGAGAVVVADTEPDGVYLGTPARRQAAPGA